VTFRTQEFAVATPVEGDAYTILKYLATVTPVRGKAPGPPYDSSNYLIAVTASPERLVEAGWQAARLLGPDTAPFARAGAGAPAGPDVDHGR